jgi:hypothetical protein
LGRYNLLILNVAPKGRTRTYNPPVNRRFMKAGAHVFSME